MTYTNCGKRKTKKISAHSETWYCFQSMDEVNRYDGLLLVNEHGNLYFLLHNFGGQIIPFKLEELKKNIGGKKIHLKVWTKPLARGCNHHPTTRGMF